MEKKRGGSSRLFRLRECRATNTKMKHVFVKSIEKDELKLKINTSVGSSLPLLFGVSY